jgi:hypothetical protein
MKTSKMAKIVFFKNIAEFASDDGDTSGYMEDATLYEIDMPDDVIISFFDDDYAEHAKVYTVRISMETIIDLKETE